MTGSQTANIDTESNFMLEVRKHSSTATHACMHVHPSVKIWADDISEVAVREIISHMQ